MSRRYYDTAEKVYSLLINHPATGPIISAFGFDGKNVMNVAKYLIANDAKINANALNAYYVDSDMLDEIAELYGYTIKPYKNYLTQGGTSYLELLDLTIYLYKFGVTDNFYEKHFLDFLPEYDRTQIENAPKMKLTIQSLGRKLDQMEDQIARLSELYDIDKCPEEFLDHLGQNLGYEREDFSLSNVSFRELLKNIIEIYKVKGTNYSFSFFFKFLGFEIDLKEYYFNRDEENPQSFPGKTKLDVEYYLTVTNPIKETGKTTSGTQLKPAKYLRQIRNLDDWKLEIDSLTKAGCSNPSEYMRGVATYNEDGETWHSNPWTYFKANLIEYELSTFTSASLTASDNETIKKYVKFLSPTYLFTWINVNLTPWIEDINILTDYSDGWLRNVTKVLGDPRPTPSPWPQFPQGLKGIPKHKATDPWIKKTSNDAGFTGPYYDYENLLTLNLFKTNGESLLSIINKTLNLDGADQWGTVLRHNGEHSRNPNSPSHISGVCHKADKRLCYDSLEIEAKKSDGTSYYDYSSQPLPAIPIVPDPSTGSTIVTTNNITLSWESIFNTSEYWIQLATDDSFTDTQEWRNSYLLVNNKQTANSFIPSSYLSNDKYYWRLRTRNILDTYYNEDQTDTWSNYISVNKSGYTPNSYIHKTGWGPWSDVYNFTLNVIPYPFDGEIIDHKTYYVSPTYSSGTFVYAPITLKWKSVTETDYYEIELANGSAMSFKSSTNSITRNFTNGKYTWRIRAINTDGDTGDWSDYRTFTVNFS